MFVTWSAKLRSPIPKYETASKRSWIKFNFETFCDVLRNAALVGSETANRHDNDVDKLVNQFNSVAIRLLDDLAPVILFTVQERDHRPGFDAESRETRKSVRRLKRLFKANKTVASHEAWRSALKLSRKQSHTKSASYWKLKQNCRIT